MADPFPVRDRQPYETLPGNSLGFDTMLGRGFNAENRNRVHARVQRWRLGWQRELNGRTALEIAYSGSYADRQGMQIRQDYLPEQYWSSANVRDTSANDFLTQNVPNPFAIANFAALRTSNPLLYQRMQGSTTFTQATIQRQRLLRAFPHMNNLQYRDQPLGEIKAHSLEIILTRRYANGLTGNAGFTVNRVTENRTVEMRPGADAVADHQQRPAVAADRGVATTFFGPGKRFLANRGLSPTSLAGGRLAVHEYQPGALLNWGSLFFTAT
jgi:hypothetical protein